MRCCWASYVRSLAVCYSFTSQAVTRKIRYRSVVVVVTSFLFVLGTNGRMQPVVMAPKNLSTQHYGLNKIKEKDNTAEENTREKQKKDPRET